MIDRIRSLLRQARAFLERDLISSIGHALLVCAVVLIVRWVARGDAGATWWAAGIGVGFYVGREVQDAIRFSRERSGAAFLAKLGDGWLDLVFPIVFSSALALVLT